MNFRNSSSWRRPLALLVIVPVVATLLITALYYGNLHRLSAVDRIESLDALDLSTQSRAIVFAPHCDDETLGVGGVIKLLTDAGTPVRTVFFTNGDGFRIAAQFHLKKLNLTAADSYAFRIKGFSRCWFRRALPQRHSAHQLPKLTTYRMPTQRLLAYRTCEIALSLRSNDSLKPTSLQMYMLRIHLMITVIMRQLLCSSKWPLTVV
jgi:hypothetical protein